MSLLSKNRSVRNRIFLAFLSITLLSSFCYMYYGYVVNSNSLVNGLDKRLLVATVTIDQLLPPDFIDRCMGDGPPLTDKEKDSVMRSILQLRDNSEMAILYAMTEDTKTGQIIMPIATDEAKPENGKSPKDGVGVVYHDPWPGIVETLQDGKTRFDEGEDDYGNTRSAYLRRYTRLGRPYVLGADINITDVRSVKLTAFSTFFLIAVLTLVSAAVAGWYLSKRISRPIQRLSHYTNEWSRSGFSPDMRIPEDMLPTDEHCHDENALLAADIDSMRDALSAHLSRLQAVMEQKERVEGELRIAGSIQQSYLPQHFGNNPAVDGFATLIPAKNVGGDLFDYKELDDTHVFFALGDVTGKGVPAALFMTVVLALLRAGVRQMDSLKEIMDWTNACIEENNPDCTFVTLFIGVLDTQTGRLLYCNGGHNPPILQHADGSADYIPNADNPIVGIMPDISYNLHEMRLEPGERLIVYSDGVTEAMNIRNECYGDESFLQAVTKIPLDASARRVAESIVEEVRHFAGQCDQSDDITILVLNRKP